MANRHFAKLGDIWKHLPLAEVLHLNPPRHYWETHAGSPTYPLTPNSERAHGAFHFVDAARAGLDPKSVLVHIDPYLPHERLAPDAQTPVELAATLAGRGFRLFYWYGYDHPSERGWARQAIARLAPGCKLWCGDALMRLRSPRRGVRAHQPRGRVRWQRPRAPELRRDRVS